MIDFIKVMAVIIGLVFPTFLIKAFKAQNIKEISEYTILASISFGIIVFILMGLH